MKLRNVGFLLALTIIAAVSVAAVPPDETLGFVHATVIDATGSPAQPDMTVIVADRRIVEIGTSASVSVPKNARVVEARDKFLIPGLWDMHVHEIFGDWIPEDEKISPLLFVANGVTGVRDMGGDLEPLKKWRSRIASGDMLGPRMIFAGHVPDAVRAVEASNAGQKSIEHLTGVFEGCSSVEAELMSKPRGPGRGRFLATYDPAKAKALIALFLKNQTWQVPTLFWEQGEWLIEQTNVGPDPLVKYAPAAWRERTWPMFTRDILKSWSTDPVAEREAFVQAEFRMVGEMHRAGVPILAGTDTAAGVRVCPGFRLR